MTQNTVKKCSEMHRRRSKFKNFPRKAKEQERGEKEKKEKEGK